MKVSLSWIREFVDVKESAEDIGRLMSVRGLPLEGLEPHGGDVVMDFEVTANRPDCMSVVGIAREIATAYDLPMIPFRAPALQANGALPIAIEDPSLCARYVGAVAEVTVAPSPTWMQDRLSMCGVRPISNIVDITNYVMLELGQPMHAFDLAKMRQGQIIVRRAKPGETMTTLDGKRRSLAQDMLVIADAECAEDIGGVMGGAGSEIASTTKQVAFEAAWFHPSQIRSTSRKLGLKTEASMRFERGADRTAPPRAMARALQLLEQIGGGKGTGAVTDNYPVPYQPKTMHLERKRIGGLLGMEVPDAAVKRILTSLGFEVTPMGDGWDVIPPSWRVDMHRQVDLIEEVGRHHGFEHLPTTFPGVQHAPPPSDPRIARDRRYRNALLAMGFSEAITFAFIEQGAAGPFVEDQGQVALANPLSEKFAVMRPSLLPGLIGATSHNRRHGRRDVRLFEIGTCFAGSGERRSAGFIWTGTASAELWDSERRNVEFADIRGVVEQLLAVRRVKGFFESPKPLDVLDLVETHLVGQRVALIYVGATLVGTCGQLEPAITAFRGLPEDDEIYVGEINLDALDTAAPTETLRASAPPRFPSVVRDVSILLDDHLSAESVRGTIQSAGPDTLASVREFDRYQGKGIPDGKVSLSLRLTFQSPERTLTDDEVSTAMTTIVVALKLVHNAEQR